MHIAETLHLKQIIKPFAGLAHQIYNPAQDKVGRVIMGMMVGAQTLISVFWIRAFSDLGEGYAVMVLFPYAYIIISYSSMLVFYRLKRANYFTFTQLAMLLVMPFFMQWIIGGYEASSGIAIWGILSPVGALLLLGRKQSTYWFLLFFVLAMFSWGMNDTFASYAPEIPNNIKQLSFIANVCGAASILYFVMRYFQSQTEQAMIALVGEQGKTDKLLLNILPKSIADRLKQSGERIADQYDAVTIMFTDIVGFTTLSSGMPADDLVELLSRVFSRFDELTEKHGVEKIKTIGDSYMVVCGAPEPRADHAGAVADLALDMMQTINEISAQGATLTMRIGINSGPVVAGVIGSSKFSYDLWGDTVNMASRMEHHGAPNRIHVSEETYHILKDDYVFEMRDRIEVKGKGLVQSYFLLKKNPVAVAVTQEQAASTH